jgi:UDP-N-acetyl-2-amino-2-deoxyglucuronate dehydrogenase
MEKLRFAVIGIKGIGRTHLRAIQGIEDAQLVAVCDIDEAAAQQAAAQLGIRAYTDYEELVKAEDIDVVTIATPHYLHMPMTVAALEAGKHVICEKPIAISIGEADRMIATARTSGRLLGICHNARTSPGNRALKELLAPQQAGQLMRMVWISGGIRTQGYYDSAEWRGTWAQEGGGTLINQKVHDLDLICWLVGRPVEVLGITGNFVHKVERGIDTLASALFRWENGAQGVFQGSITDGAGQSHHEFHCERLAVFRGPEGIRVGRFAQNVKDFIRQAGRNDKLEVTWETVQPPEAEAGHIAVFRQFIQAVRAGGRPLCPPEEARQALELVNAITLSAARHRPVKLPLDATEYSAFLKEIRARAAFAL